MKKKPTENRRWKIKRWFVLFGVVLLIVYWICEASGEETDQTSVNLQLSAEGAVLMDGYTGRILYQKNGTEILPMASTTKIMTCILALELGNVDDWVEVSAYAASMPDVQLGINQGERYRLGDLLLSLMLESHNDSAVAIAEYIASVAEETEKTSDSERLVSEFAALMNQKAAEIGCENTYFITPNGLDATETAADENGQQVERSHSTTAADLARIMRYCLSQSEQAGEFIRVTQTREASFSDESGKRSFSCSNHNSYLERNADAISGKTGYTGNAGYCYVGAVNQDGVFLIVALLACGWPPSKNLKWQDMDTLVEYGESHYSCVQVDELPVAVNEYLVSETSGTYSRKQSQLVRIQNKILFEPFSVLLGEGETLSGYWYQELEDADPGETVGEYGILAGGMKCKTFPIIINQKYIWVK